MKKRIVATVLLVAHLLLCLASCGSEPHTHEWSAWTTTKAPTCETVGEESRTCSCGEIQTAPLPILEHEVGDWVITVEPTDTEEGEASRSCTKCGKAMETQTIPALGDGTGGTSGEDTYTYHTSTTHIPSNWNPHSSEEDVSAYNILKYTRVGFYSFDYNESKDGYKFVPEMATALPVDVTAEYAEKYGIDPDTTALIWKITLRRDLTWEDGTPITAHDFVESAKLLLDPQAKNYRAETLFSGSLVIIGAQQYLQGGDHLYTTPMIPTFASEEYVDPDDFTVNEQGHLLTPDGNDVCFNIDDGGTWSATNSLTDYYNAFYFQVTDSKGNDLYRTKILDAADENGNVIVTQEIADILSDAIAQLHGCANADDYAAALDNAYGEGEGLYAYREWQEFCYLGSAADITDFDDVGIFAPSDYELVLALETPLDGFYLYNALTETWLVNVDLYKACESVTDGVYTNTYGTSVDTYLSYGPYKLTYYKAGEQIKLTKNGEWYGHKDHPELYQTTDIRITLVASGEESKELFLQGKLDDYTLTVEDWKDYQASEYTYLNLLESTLFIALNPDFGPLESNQGEGRNKTILTIKEFRMALSLSLDRTAFARETRQMGYAALGLFTDYAVADPENGTLYRATEQAKKVLQNVWGGCEFTEGYNLTLAREYFNKAYDAAIAMGMMKETDVVEITIGIPNGFSPSGHNIYTNGYAFLVENYTEAVKGTKLEGKLFFTVEDGLGNSIFNALKNNRVDMIFGVGWIGSPLDPYSLIEMFVSPEYQYNDSYHFDQVSLTVEIDGVDWYASAYDWMLALGGADVILIDADGNEKIYNAGSASGVPQSTRAVILAALEGAVLETYEIIPLIAESNANLKGMQINYYTEEYVYGVGRGGVKYMTYNYTDAEWEEFVAQNGGVLNYE